MLPRRPRCTLFPYTTLFRSIQVSVGGGEYASGSTIKDRVTGTRALAAYAHEVAKNYDVTIALHTDHCTKENLDSRSEEHTSELQSRGHLVCRLLLEKKHSSD